MHRIILQLLFATYFASAAVAQGFPEVFNTEPESDDSLIPASDAAASLLVPKGFSSVAFAHEPDVQNPIAMSWDSRGRLWIAENYTYAERQQRFQLDLRDRVIILDNTTGERFEKRKVFTDRVQMLTGLEVGHDGVWLMCPPKLIFIPDRDHDDVPDSAGEVVLDGFTVAQQNYHNFANGLRFGPDGWLYGRCGGSCPGRIGKPGAPDHQRLALEGGIWRYHPTRRVVEVLTSGTTNPWGHDWNAVGELFFVNTVNGHLWHMIPGAHFTRPFLLDPNRRTYELIDYHADHWHFDTGESWTKSRDGAANSFGGGHAHSGTMIYQGDNWPREYQGQLFTLNFHGRRANQETLVRSGGGYVAKHNDDFFISNDTWFRGMELSSGPDGGVFVLDWSDAGECHEHTGVHRTSGRVYKITYEGRSDPKEATTFDLRQWTQDALAQTHTGPNDWYLRQARLELVRRHVKGDDMSVATEIIRSLFESSPSNHRLAVQTLLTMHVIGAADARFLREQLRHPSEHVRAWAIRLLTETLPIDDTLGPVWCVGQEAKRIRQQADLLQPIFCEMASNDLSALVRLTLASTLQRLPVSHRASLAKSLVARAEDADDHNTPLMIWYGLIAVADVDCQELVDVARACRLPTTLRLISRCLAEEIENHPHAMNELLAYASSSNDDSNLSIVLSGIAEGLKGWRQAPRPSAWNKITKMDSTELSPLIRELSVVFGDGRALDEIRRIATSRGEAESAVRLAALQTLIDQNPEDLRDICESLLQDQHLNVLAARGLSKFADPAIGEAIVARYRNFRAPFRPQIMSILVSRPSFARSVLEAIDKGKIPRSDLSAYQVRQIHSFGDADLSNRVSQVWGEVRESPKEKQDKINLLKEQLSPESLAAADLGEGRVLFTKHCRTCHRLYGDGAAVGPDLTGSNRGNLDYLLSNVIDPSAVVDKNFRMTVFVLDDGRIVNGLVISESDRTVSVQTATETFTLDRDSIEIRKTTEKSPMPDGLFDTLTDGQIRNLVGYLQHPTQVALPNAR